MSLHLSVLLTVILFVGLSVLLYRKLLLNLNGIKKAWLHVMLFGFALLGMRLLLPAEFSFTKTVLVTWWGLPELIYFLRSSLFSIGNTEVYLATILMAVWALVAAALTVQSVYGYFRFKRRIMRSAEFISDPSTLVAEPIASLLQKHANICIIRSPVVETPIVFGYIKPVIALPTYALTPKEWSLVIGHELKHYFHGDLWLILLLKVQQIVYWWNPLSYSLSRLATEVLEIRNDKIMVSTMKEEERIEYYECLLSVAKHRKKKHLRNAALAFGNSTKATSIRRYQLIDRDTGTYSKKAAVTMGITMVTLMLTLLLSFFVVLEPAKIFNPEALETISLTSENAFLIRISENEYELYVDGEYAVELGKAWEDDDNTPGSLALLPIYQNIEEANGR